MSNKSTLAFNLHLARLVLLSFLARHLEILGYNWWLFSKMAIFGPFRCKGLSTRLRIIWKNFFNIIYVKNRSTKSQIGNLHLKVVINIRRTSSVTIIVVTGATIQLSLHGVKLLLSSKLRENQLVGQQPSKSTYICANKHISSIIHTFSA